MRSLSRWCENAMNDALEQHQSPAGHWYENHACDWIYTERTHAGNVWMAWHYAQGTDFADLFVKGEKRWADWMGYNAGVEPDGSAHVLNRAIESRKRGNFIPRHNPLGEVIPKLRPFLPSREETAKATAEERRRLEADWPKVPPMEIGSFRAFDPHRIVNLPHPRWYPTAEQRAEAIKQLPCMAKESFNHQRVDDRQGNVFTFVRRPGYYAAFNACGRRNSQQRFGLGFIWNPEAGVLLQSQTVGKDTAWGTRPAGAKTVCETSLGGARFEVGDEVVGPAAGIHDLPPGTVVVQYPLGKQGQGTKEVAFDENGITVKVKHPGKFAEQLPLLIPSGAATALEDGTLRVKGADWSLEVSSNSASATLEPTEKTVLGKKLFVLRLAGEDQLEYDMRFSKP